MPSLFSSINLNKSFISNDSAINHFSRDSGEDLQEPPYLPVIAVAITVVIYFIFLSVRYCKDNKKLCFKDSYDAIPDQQSNSCNTDIPDSYKCMTS